MDILLKYFFQNFDQIDICNKLLEMPSVHILKMENISENFAEKLFIEVTVASHTTQNGSFLWISSDCVPLQLFLNLEPSDRQSLHFKNFLYTSHILC